MPASEQKLAAPRSLACLQLCALVQARDRWRDGKDALNSIAV
jgi:hypothetical protein